MAEVFKQDDTLRFKRNSIGTSLLSSEELSLSYSSQRQLSDFPDVSISIASSCENSDDVEMIRSKTSEMSRAIANKLGKLSEIFQPFSEDCNNKEKLLGSSDGFSATLPIGIRDLGDTLRKDQIIECSSRLKVMKMNLMHSKKMLRSGVENINLISEENTKINEKIEEIRCRLEASTTSDQNKIIGCKCSVF